MVAGLTPLQAIPARVNYGVYVHIPWCRRACPYCAFAIDTTPEPPHVAYTDALLREWEGTRAVFPGKPSTVSFGGGTPSLAPPAELERILAAIDPLAGAEVSLEANPGDVRERLADLRAAGITRLSLGVQSFDPWVARRLGRGHTSDDARTLVEDARATGFRSLNVDIIFAVPGQTLAMFERDLDAILETEPDHVSLYGLTIEEGTPFARSHRQPVDEDTWRAMYDTAVERMERAGIGRYEVSNFARPGHRCAHNEHYWRARHWAGLGVSAHGWLPDGVRTANVVDVQTYLTAADPRETVERPEPHALAFELVWSTLRHVDGVDLDLLAQRTGLGTPATADFVATGLVFATADNIRLTPAGFPVSDGLARRICDSLKPVDR